MNIDERVKKAYALHHSGYNCAQAVLGAYVDLFDLDMDRAMTIAYGFGGGVGMTREICGTLTGGAMALGLKYGKGEADVKQFDIFLSMTTCHTFRVKVLRERSCRRIA